MIQSEALRIFKVVNDLLGAELDGKDCILKMKQNGSNNWKQMEWMGFYLEEEIRDLLIEKIGGSLGPKYGNTRIDYMNEYPWDIKAHSLHNSKGDYQNESILNDTEAITRAIDEFGSIGFVMFIVEPTWDIDGSFKEWHDIEKGKISEYEIERINRGAKSRMRKVSCTIDKILIFKIDADDIKDGFERRWLKGFQEGMRNADGSPRRSKVNVLIDRIPKHCIIGD